MATERRTGLGSLPAGLLRPTTPPEPTIPAEAPEVPEAEPGDGAGGDQRAAEAVAAAGVTPKPRRKRPVVASKTTGRKLQLPDDIHDRLWLLARQRRTTVSAVAADLLDRSLPRYRVEREG